MARNSYLTIVESFNIHPYRKKIISFSLYGIGTVYETKRDFYKGIFVNYELAKTVYPGWIIRIYMPHNEPREYINNIIKIKDIELILVDTNICLRALRYLPNDDPLVDVWISRDLDSILTDREKVAVDDWLDNYPDKELHIMTDNSHHYWIIAGGMFGVKNSNHNLVDFMLEFSENKSANDYAVDCTIAEKFFYKHDNYIQHYGAGKKLENSKPFPHHKPNCSFVGEIVNIITHYQNLNIYYKYFGNFDNYILKYNDMFSYSPWNTHCILKWYNETDFTLTPIMTKTSTCSPYNYLKTENGDGMKVMNTGARIHVLWDNHVRKEVYLKDENTLIVMHDREYEFTRVIERVSVVIPTFNRFAFLLHTIKSIQEQTYKHIEIIVVNDGSTEKEYYEHNWDGITIIHLEKNTKEIFGFACAAYVRNKGIEKASGKYIAFCDDDDIWFPSKLELQLCAMKKTGCKMSSTDGLIGNGVYDSTKTYMKYNSENYMNTLKSVYKHTTLLDNGIPEIWNLDFLKIHNCVICSSVVIEKEILMKINMFLHMKPPGEDYDCWLRALEHTDSVYVSDICFYYDNNHGYGINY